MKMTRITRLGVVLAAFCLVAVHWGALGAAGTGEHDYFNSLVTRNDLWKSYSLRDQSQVLLYKNANSIAPSVNYLWPNDPDPHAQDAAKVVIPVVSDVVRSNLAVPATATDTVLTLSYWSSEFYAGRVARLDNELLLVGTVDKTLKTINVTRGVYGSSAAPHAAGTAAYLSTNSLQNQLRVPVGAESGYTYLITWDTMWTDSYIGSGLSNHKTFQLSNGSDNLWLEAQTRYAGDYASTFSKATDIGGVTLRSYNALGGNADYSQNSTTTAYVGPGVTKVDPILPMAGSFTIKPNRWTRFWVRLDMRASDYDYIDYWVADEEQGPVQIYKQIPVSGGSVAKLWLEFNTSQDRYTRGAPARDLVAYVRNVVMLRGTPSYEVPSLLQRPVGGTPTPAPPRNLRIVK